MTTHHEYVLFPLLQTRTVTHIRNPQELPVHQTEAVPVGVDDLDVVTRLLSAVELIKDFGPKN